MQFNPVQNVILGYGLLDLATVKQYYALVAGTSALDADVGITLEALKDAQDYFITVNHEIGRLFIN